MRLSEHQRRIIKEEVARVMGGDARVLLFGSRTDDSQRGGDIDLLIELPRPSPDARKKSLTLAAHLQMRLGDQPIDILLLDPETVVQPIHRIAATTGVPL